MERGLGELSAVQEVCRDYGMPVISIVTLDDLAAHLSGRSEWDATLAAIRGYRASYGIVAA
jgi:orotate phosphoribosyltransferase